MYRRDFLNLESRDSIKSAVVKTLLGGYACRGFDPGDLLERLGEPRSLLEDAEAQFPIEKVRELVVTVARELEDEALAFLQQPIRLGGLAMSVHATINCETLREAMRRWNLFWRLAHDFEFCVVTTSGEEAKVSGQFPAEDGLDRSMFIVWTVLFVLRWGGWLIGKPLVPNRVHLPFAPPVDLSDYDAIFPCRHYFSQRDTAAFFDKRFIDMPVVQSPRSVPEFLKNIPDLLTTERSDESLTGQIKRMLQSTDGSVDALPLKAVAETLHADPRTIRRRLKREGSSYAEIKEGVRRDLAIYHLRRLETPVAEIAELVGFSDASAFNRAFRKWTGQTPGEYRSQALEGSDAVTIPMDRR
ncbi:MAG: AraC family transcriptional regulator ligand-binding domain-containing protein [Myxococcota bacterium]